MSAGKRYFSGLILAAIALVLFEGASFAAGVAVIVNPENPVESMDLNDVKKIYTNNILKWPDGVPIVIYDLSAQDPSRAVFSEKVFEKPAEKVADEWAHLKITNQAKNPPLTMKSEALIIRRISKEKGAIGYVSEAAAKGRTEVKVIIVLQ